MFPDEQFQIRTLEPPAVFFEDFIRLFLVEYGIHRGKGPVVVEDDLVTKKLGAVDDHTGVIEIFEQISGTADFAVGLADLLELRKCHRPLAFLLFPPSHFITNIRPACADLGHAMPCPEIGDRSADFVLQIVDLIFAVFQGGIMQMIDLALKGIEQIECHGWHRAFLAPLVAFVLHHNDRRALVLFQPIARGQPHRFEPVGQFVVAEFDAVNGVGQ